ncbi:MAG: choice-of-anchor Q domain-containing protein, partial [Anaerolineae bacterium]
MTDLTLRDGSFVSGSLFDRREFLIIRPFILAVLLCILLWAMTYSSIGAYEGIHYVAPTGTDSEHCTPQSPCLTIQQAISNAVAGDEIRVAAGTYSQIFTINDEVQVAYIGKNVTLKGGFTTSNWLSADPTANATTIDAQGNGRGIYVGVGANQVEIDGFHVRNGAIDEDYGAGVRHTAGELLLRNCQIYDNHSTGSGSVSSGGGVATGLAGADTTLTLQASDLYSNSAYSAGGAVAVVSGTVVIEGNHIFDNDGTRYGAVAVIDGDVILRNNWLYGNDVVKSGGGLATLQGRIQVLNNTFFENTAVENGGGVLILGGTVGITNTLVVSNTAGGSGGGLQGAATVDYTDFYGNSPAQDVVALGGTGNRTQDPQFVNPAAHDLHLSSDSLAIDTGTDLPEVTEDIDGNGRPFGSDFDRGGDEVTFSVPCYARLNAGQVYTSVQMAVDASTSAGDVIKVAGYCQEIHTHSDISATLYLDKSLVVRGAYTATDWTTPRYGPTILDAAGAGHVIYAEGAGITLTLESLHVTGGSEVWGTGVYLGEGVEATLRNNAIYHNDASIYGGGVFNQGTAYLWHNTIYSNTAQQGGGVYNGGTLVLENNVVASNRVSGSGGGIHATTAAETSLDYNDFYGNYPDDYGPLLPGEHDLAIPPAFVDPDVADFHLDLNSPLVNAADPASTVATDFEGDARPQGATSDIGADERVYYADVALSDAPNSPFTRVDVADLQGQIVVFTHTITNTGQTPTLYDTFDVETENLEGWPVTPGTVSGVELASGASYTFQISVTVPIAVEVGFYNTTLVTVTSRTSADAFDVVQDVIANPGLELTPEYHENADPGEVLMHTHTLTNAGPAGNFDVDLVSSMGWSELVFPTAL